MNNILVVAAHPDDELLGVGGTIKKYSNMNYNCYCVILGEGMTSREEQSDSVENLHKSAISAANIIGFKKVYFENLPDNRFDSVDLLDVVKIVEKYIKLIKPSIMYTHHHGDVNIDHQITFNAVLTACRPISPVIVRELYAFDTLSSTEWQFKYGDKQFKPNVFVNIEDTMEDKIKAMKEYTTEVRKYPHPRSIEGIKIQAQKYGMISGNRFSEAFELIFNLK